MTSGHSCAENKSGLPVDDAMPCIDYPALALYLKNNMCSHTLQKDLKGEGWSFGEEIRQRLGTLQQTVPLFVERLDVQVAKAAAVFDKRLASLAQQIHQGNNDNGAHAALLALERFALVNYIAMIKILNECDRRSGLCLSETYLSHVAKQPWLDGAQLKQLEQRIARESIPQHYGIVHVSFCGTFGGSDTVDAILGCLARYPCTLLDLSLGPVDHGRGSTMTLDIQTNSESVPMLRDLAKIASAWGVDLLLDYLDTQPTAKPCYTSSQDSPGQIVPSATETKSCVGPVKYVASLLDKNGLRPEILSRLAGLLLKHKVSIGNLTRLCPKDQPFTLAELYLSVPSTIDMDSFSADIFALTKESGTDVALQKDNVFRRNKRLVVFDMDSTLIRQEVIDEIARHAGIMDKVAAITEAAMNGEIDFKESLRRRVALLKGTSVDVIETVRQSLTFTQGAHDLCRALKRLGFKLAVISGGFIPLARYVKNELGLDYAFANQLEVSSDGKTLTGSTVGPIVDGVRKSELLEVIAQAENICLNQVVAVGDGANDLWMMRKAGLGIAFHAKPRVQEQAPACINQNSLRHVLTLFGYSDEDVELLCQQ